jgi:hypothetical protein
VFYDIDIDVDIYTVDLVLTECKCVLLAKLLHCQDSMLSKTDPTV